MFDGVCSLEALVLNPKIMRLKAYNINGSLFFVVIEENTSANNKMLTMSRQ